jgi:hypothetical protein
LMTFSEDLSTATPTFFFFIKSQRP